MVFNFYTELSKDAFNERLNCTVPGCWKAFLCENISEVLGSPDYLFHVVEGIGRTEKDAILMLKNQLQSLGLSGTLRKS